MNEDLDIPVRTYRASVAADAGSRRMLLIAVGIAAIVLVAAGGVAWLRHGHAARTIPVITADPRPVRVKPTDPGGLQVAGQGEDILSGGGDGGDADTVTPAPEAPALGALRARQTEPGPAVGAATPGAATPGPATPGAPTPGAPTPGPATPGAVTPAPPPIPPLTPPAMSHAPAVTPAKTAAETPGPRPSGLDVMLGALPTEAAARIELERITRKAPDLFASRPVRVDPASRDGRPLWQLRAGPFTDIAGATMFCVRLRAKAISCALATG